MTTENTLELSAELERMYGTCRCGDSVFASWSPERFQKLLKSVRRNREKWGSDGIHELRCRKCERRADRIRALGWRVEDMEAKIRDGLVQAPLWSYAKPWTQAEKQNPAHWKFAREWNLKDFSASRNLWLWGPEGVGKTALARYLLMRAYLGRYDSEERLWVEGTPHIAEVQASDFELAFVRMTAKEKARLQRLCAVDFLLIDDMANVAWRQWSLMKLWQVVHFRYERRLRTFFTCSMQAAALHDVFVNAWEENAGFAMQLLRRIRPYWELQFTGESLRLLHGADSQPVVKGAKDGKEGG